MEREEGGGGGGRKTHIIVFPFPLQGHLNPMAQFAKRLASKGALVTLLLTTASTSMQLQGSSGLRIEYLSDGFGEVKKPDDIDVFFQLFEVQVSKNLADFIESEKSNNKTSVCPEKLLLVYDSVIPWALDVAHRLGLQGASFFTQSCFVSIIYYHMLHGTLKTPRQSVQEEDDPSSDRISLPAMPLMRIKDLPSLIYDSGSYPAIQKIAITQFSNLQEADWVLLNSFDRLEGEIVNWTASRFPMMRLIGPTIPSMYLDKRLQDDRDYGMSLFKPNAEACMKWLDAKETDSVVFVSFGSMADLSKDQMEEIAFGLLRMNRYFLWVVRASEGNKLPRNFREDEEKLHENGLIVKWCPQLQVLDHKAVGCFVTHCGWNSTLEALSLGVPLVAIPQWTDQTTNSKFVADIWKVGVRAKANKEGIVTREEIGKCVEQVMDNASEFRKNALSWKGLAKEAVDEGGSSDNNILEFVTKLACK